MLSKKHLKRSLFLLAGIYFSLFTLCGAVQGDTSEKSPWQRHETKHTIIKYMTLEDLRKFDSNIDYSPGGWSLKSMFSTGDSKNPAGSIATKLDALYEKVQGILGMRGKIKKVIIEVYPNRKELHKTYFSITGRKCHVKGWYIFEINTIYLNNDDVHEGILAHEMAHSIINHYFSVRPPKNTAEILGRYVDQHLEF
jgi:hypothetical protein